MELICKKSTIVITQASVSDRSKCPNNVTDYIKRTINITYADGNETNNISYYGAFVIRFTDQNVIYISHFHHVYQESG
jgi:hypothetical protein